MSLVVNQSRYKEEYSLLKRTNTNSHLSMLRLAQLALKNGDYENCNKYVRELERDSLESDTEFKMLLKSFKRNADFQFRLTEIDSSSIESSFKYEINDLNAESFEAEAYINDIYTASVAFLQNLDPKNARIYLNQLKSFVAQWSLNCISDLQELFDHLKILEFADDLDAIEKQLREKSRGLTRGSIHNLALLMRIKSRRGDYDGVYSLIRHFPDFVLPPKTKLLASLASHAPLKFDQREIETNSDLYWVNVLSGVVERDPDRILQAGFFPSDTFAPRIHLSARIARAWAFIETRQFSEAAKELNDFSVPTMEYDQAIIYALCVIKINIETRFSVQKTTMSLQKAIDLVRRVFKYLSKGKTAYEKNILPTFSDCIWFLMGIDEQFKSYFEESEEIVICERGVFTNGKLYTTPIYKAIFLRKTESYNKESLKKAMQRINYRLITSRRYSLLNFENISLCLNKFTDLYRSSESALRKNFYLLEIKVSHGEIK
jgi:hypothetical protein